MLDFLKFWKKSEGSMPKFPDEGPPLDFGAQGMPPAFPSEVPGEMPGISAPSGFEPTSAMAPEQPSMFGPKEAVESPRAFASAGIGPAPAQPAFASSSQDKEFQLINAKLDSIKASIDSLHQRLDKMEIEKGRREEKEIYAWR